MVLANLKHFLGLSLPVAAVAFAGLEPDLSVYSNAWLWDSNVLLMLFLTPKPNPECYHEGLPFPRHVAAFRQQDRSSLEVVGHRVG